MQGLRGAHVCAHKIVSTKPSKRMVLGIMLSSAVSEPKHTATTFEAAT